MADGELQAVLSRIESALARIEAIEPRRTHNGIAEAYAQLDERHGLLRLRVQETVERLDALIEAGKSPVADASA